MTRPKSAGGWVTAVCALVSVAWVVWEARQPFVAGRGPARPDFEASRDRVWGVALDADATADSRPVWLRPWDALWPKSANGVLRDAEADYSRRPPSAEALFGRMVHAIILAESGRLSDAEQFLAADPELSEFFLATLQFAYGRDGAGPRPREEPRSDLVFIAECMPWAADRLEERHAERRGVAWAAGLARERTRLRGVDAHVRFAIVDTLWLILLLAGGGVALAWVLRRRPLPRLSALTAVPPWTSAEGAAALARGGCAWVGACGAIIAVPCAWPILVGWHSALQWLPAVAVIERTLLRPRAIDLARFFSLWVPRRSFGPLMVFTLGVSGVEMLGSDLLSAGFARLGIVDPWLDMFDGSLLWLPAGEAGARVLDSVLWAPIFEEVVFRGFVYMTARTWLRPLPSALLAGVLFAMIHGYPLVAFVLLVWSAVVWSLAFERCRSLLPGVLCHSAHNALCALAVLLPYRI